MYTVHAPLHTGGESAWKGRPLAHQCTRQPPEARSQQLRSSHRPAISSTIVLLARSSARAKMVRRSAIYNTGIHAPFLLRALPNPALCRHNRCTETDLPGVATALVCRNAHASGITASMNDVHACASVSYRVGGPNKRRHRLKMGVYDILP